MEIANARQKVNAPQNESGPVGSMSLSDGLSTYLPALMVVGYWAFDAGLLQASGQYKPEIAMLLVGGILAVARIAFFAKMKAAALNTKNPNDWMRFVGLNAAASTVAGLLAVSIVR